MYVIFSIEPDGSTHYLSGGQKGTSAADALNRMAADHPDWVGSDAARYLVLDTGNTWGSPMNPNGAKCLFRLEKPQPALRAVEATL